MNKVIHNGDHLQYELDNAGVAPEQRSDWPLPSFKAEDWANAFCKQNPTFDKGMAIAWFACALMTGYDRGRVASLEAA